MLCTNSTYFKEKKREYLKGALNVLETNSKKKKDIRVLYIGIDAFRKALKEGKVDGLTGPHIMWKNHLTLINVIMLGGPNCSMYS